MSKYGAIRTTVDGITFASKAEAARYKELCLLLRGGEISDLQLQPRFPLVVNGVKCGTYVADFQYVSGGSTHVEDVKGVSTPVYALKKKLVKAIHGIDIEEIR